MFEGLLRNVACLTVGQQAERISKARLMHRTISREELTPADFRTAITRAQGTCLRAELPRRVLVVSNGGSQLFGGPARAREGQGNSLRNEQQRQPLEREGRVPSFTSMHEGLDAVPSQQHLLMDYLATLHG